MHRISAILGAPDAARGMFDFAQSLAAPTALKDIGMQESDLDRCAKIATQDAYPNSRSIGTKEVRALLENAYWGNRP
jgi:alcohol dehydrogenase class IV